MTKRELQRTADYFTQNLFDNIPKLECKFASYCPGDSCRGRFCMEENREYNLEEDDAALAKQIQDAPEYQITHRRQENIGLSYYGRDKAPAWTDPLYKPRLWIEISKKLQQKPNQCIATLLHELTHYWCWYCGFDYDDGSPQFENKLESMGLPSNYNRAFEDNRWKDTNAYEHMSKYVEMLINAGILRSPANGTPAEGGTLAAGNNAVRSTPADGSNTESEAPARGDIPKSR